MRNGAVTSRHVRERRLEVVHLRVVPRREAPAALAVQVVVVAVGAAAAGDLVRPAPALVEVRVEIGDAGAHADGREQLRARADERRAFSAVAVAVDADALRIDVAHLDHLAHRGLDALEHVAVRRAGVEVDVGQHRDVALGHRLHRRRAHAGEVRRRAVAVHVLRVLLRRSSRSSAASRPACSRRAARECPAAAGRPCS